MKLTFATWNIKNGGIDDGSDARLRRQMELLASLAPAVVALQECKFWDRENYRSFHLAERLLGHHGYLGRSAATWPRPPRRGGWPRPSRSH